MAESTLAEDIRGPLRCKGSWHLGSACGRCSRCAEEAIDLMPSLIGRDKKLGKVEKLVDAIYDFPEMALSTLKAIREYLKK